MREFREGDYLGVFVMQLYSTHATISADVHPKEDLESSKYLAFQMSHTFWCLLLWEYPEMLPCPFCY